MPFAGAYVPPKRSAAAVEGIAMLKAGAPAQKSGRSGKPHATTFRLSDDEQKLSWDGAGLGKLNVLKGERYVRVSSFLELLVGHESAVFQRSGSAAAASNMHLSLSLVLSQALPARPSSMSDVRSEVVGSAPSERETLDITCDDEESFGLWVAALRALMAEVRDAQFREAELDADGKPIPLPESDSALPPPPMPGASSLDVVDPAAEAEAAGPASTEEDPAADVLLEAAAEEEAAEAEPAAAEPAADDAAAADVNPFGDAAPAETQLVVQSSGADDADDGGANPFGDAAPTDETQIVVHGSGADDAGANPFGDAADDADDAEGDADALFRAESAALTAAAAANPFGDDSAADDDAAESEADRLFRRASADMSALAVEGANPFSPDAQAANNPFGAPPPEEPPPSANPFADPSPSSPSEPEAPSNPFETAEQRAERMMREIEDI